MEYTGAPHERPSEHAPITSKRDLTALCEAEDYETGVILRKTLTFVDAHHTSWFGQVFGTRKYDLAFEQAR
jgi:hypothetical protein